MPTYKNTSNEDVALGSYRMSPGETIVTREIFKSLPAGVTKTSDLPTWNPILLSEVYTGDSGTEDVTVPEANMCRIRIKCIAGAVYVKFNTSSCTPVLKLNSNDDAWERQVPQRFVDKLILEYQSAGTEVHVLIERA